MRAECLVEAGPEAKLSVRVRFLHLDAKKSSQSAKPENWIEGVERQAEVEHMICDLLPLPQVVTILLGPLVGKLTLSIGRIDRNMLRLSIELANVTPV